MSTAHWSEEVLRRLELKAPVGGVQVGPGWEKLFVECIVTLKKLGWSGELREVKRQEGALRIRVTNVTAEVDDPMRQALGKALVRSLQTCETCGAKGSKWGLSTEPVEPVVACSAHVPPCWN